MERRYTVGIRLAALLLLVGLGVTAGGVLGRLPAVADLTRLPSVPPVGWVVGGGR
ncbi:hypothetical protein AB0J74_33940 [Asanoa sp. NPDC049573]|uniref:hypothetical protein n=1 Tax=Asanoa sp. NPDC049573 TaxID=3155396 RepID=UPI0034300A05